MGGMSLFRSGLTLILAALATAALATGRRVAFVVGVSTHQVTLSPNLTTFPNLEYAHLDAQRIARKLRELGWEVVEKVSGPGLKDEAQKASLLLNLSLLQVDRDDTVLFFYSGNGCESGGLGYLDCSDTVLQAGTEGRPGRPIAATMISLAELGQVFSGLEARRRITLLDMGRRDRQMVADPDRPPFAIRAETVFELARQCKSGAASWCVITSCDKGEESYEAPDAFAGGGGGVFASSLLDALSSPKALDQGGRLTPYGLWDQLGLQVKTWCQTNGRQMTPRFQADFVLPLDLGPPSKPGGGA